MYILLLAEKKKRAESTKYAWDIWLSILPLPILIIYFSSPSMDRYWTDRYSYFSPLYSGNHTRRHDFTWHRVAYPSSALYPYMYWAHYKSYWYKSDDDHWERNRANLLNDV